MTRNRYDFKWWHGVLGLIGLGMVLRTVRSVAGDPYRNPQIATEPLKRRRLRLSTPPMTGGDEWQSRWEHFTR